MSGKSLDPLQPEYSFLLAHSRTGQVLRADEPEHGAPQHALSEDDHATAVLHWLPDQVQAWMEQSVSFNPARMQEFLHSFRSENLDGLGLLTLQRTHRACRAMTSSEWQILKTARRRLVAGGGTDALSNLSRVTIEAIFDSPCSTPPGTPRGSVNSNAFGDVEAQDRTMNGSPRKSIWGFRWGAAKDEQLEVLEKEVQSLRGEIVGAEERETTLQAQLDHLDEVLRTSQLAGYIHMRTRWTALPHEPPIDDTDVDDWMLRFLVLRDDAVCSYLRATDLRPQGTVLISEIVEAGPIPQQKHHGGSTHWFAFQITTCHGLRLECSSQIKLQVECWLTSLGIGLACNDLERRLLEVPQSAAWQKVFSSNDLEVDASDEEKSLFGEPFFLRRG
eukprot:TRINITY_DN4245_c0_g1_i1.p1 TRINITY_DN4245_c0_g1~~TRINITY_DN4245_c0_g1_i1.p1  ORF type:complete len:389 (+),score=38.15 TRINITY_DN4245_c0_g1_i1:118-1284(+)